MANIEDLVRRAKTVVNQDKKDVAPELLEKVWTTFEDMRQKSTTLSRISSKQKLTQADVYKYAEELGKLLSKAYRTVLTEDALPDGRLYRNIAERIIPPTLRNVHDSVSDFAVTVQRSIDTESGIGINPVAPEFPEGRAKGLVNRASDPLLPYEEQMNILDEPIINFAESVMDDFVQENAKTRARMGLKTTITRVVAPGCCEWCSSLGGVYEYGEEPKDIYRRHQYCRCMVTFQSGKTSQNVWSKKTWESTPDEIKRRRTITGRIKASQGERKAALDLAARDRAIDELAKVMQLNRKQAHNYAEGLTVEEIEKRIKKKRETLGL